jgi:penicillin G amidase
MSPAVVTRLRLLASVLTVLLVAALAAVVALWWVMRRSLPALDGTAALPGLSAPVTVERDAQGVPTIRGATRTDVARALGYLHAQDRFFQMDLLRRRSAGELAELFGASAVPWDRAVRVHRFRSLARQALALLPPDQRALVDAYAAGVNAGLAALRAKPFEYYLLRAQPRPWRPEDTLLVGYSEVLDLQDADDHYERMLAAIQDAYGRTMLDFLVPRGTEFDAALDGSTFPAPPVPGPDIIDLRKPPLAANRAAGWPARLARLPEPADSLAAGSNAFALAGRRTATGSALLANDMHLSLRVPNIWYRASLEWGGGATGAAHRVTGVTIPGVPLVIAGSNGRIAWGFTNSYADTADIVVVEPSSIDPMVYRSGSDLLLMDDRHETIQVKGGKPVDAVSRWTIWGPVIGTGAHNRSFALRWVFDDPAALNLGLLTLETAPDVSAALAAAPDFGIPAQNLVVADRAGAIGWTIAGRLPRRVGCDGRLPAVWAYGDRRWNGYLPPADYPRVVSPPSGEIWTANNRTVGGADYAKLGDGGYMSSARARQIRDDLTALTAPATPRDLLGVQLDDRALLLDRWQQLLLATLTPDALADHPGRAELRRLVTHWSGRADTGSVAYTLVRRWRAFVADRALGPIFAPCRDADDRFDFHQLDYEEPLWRLVSARPPNFLTPDYFSWGELLRAAADDVVRWGGHQGRPLRDLTWGRRNTARIEHPFSRFLPRLLARFLDMPAVPLPGDNNMPRVQSPDFGASERFVVSPGHEAEGIFEMPGGESGNPLSPFYRAGFDAWARGEPTPFLPGPTRHTLRLQP